VGYKDDPSIGNGGYWIVKNSWGQNWGYNGFFNIEYGSLNIDNVQITWVEYDASPVSSFNFNPVNPGSEDIIQFTDTSRVLVGEITSWKWDFGDDTFSYDENPIKSYSNIGTYLVTLTVSDALGNIDSITRNIYVGDEIPPDTNHSFIYGSKNDNDWFTSSVGLKLKSFDSFSGVDYTLYNLNNQGYKIYNNPLLFFGPNDEGRYSLSYYSVDKSGNTEKEKTINFNIDKSDPVLKIKKPIEKNLYISNIKVAEGLPTTVIVGPLIPKFEIYDNISGINRADFYLNNDLLCTDHEYPYNCIISKNKFGYSNILKIIIYDNAGRSITESLYFILYGLDFF
jgi:PKD repeat protein